MFALQAIAVFTGLACWLVAVTNWIRMLVHRRKDVSLFHLACQSPFSLMRHPEKLTGRGLKARSWFLCGLLGFFICIIAGITVTFVYHANHLHRLTKEEILILHPN
jgi:hypothetical protein